MGKEIIRIDNVSKRYGKKVVLNDVSLTIHKGETVALIGSSGTGKTTLFNIITNTITPDSGHVFIDEKEVITYNNKMLAKKLGIMTQRFDLVNELSVINNVLAGRLSDWSFIKSLISLFYPMDKPIAEKVLKRVELLDKMYDKTANLSGGEQQRVALARLLVQHPQIILADEPIASLDPALSESVISMLINLTSEYNITLVSSLHSVDYALRFFDRIIGLKEGKIYIDSSTSAIDEEKLKELYK